MGGKNESDTRKGSRLGFRILCVGSFFLCMSQSMTINALPSILQEFSINAGYGQLLTTGYIFVLGLISASSAVLVNRFSTKRFALLSFSSFVIGCVMAAISQDFTTLLVGRFLQAGGAGISLPLIQDVALAIYPIEEYGKAMGIVGLIIGFGPALGPAVGGPIIDLLGWRALFVILGSIVAIAVILTFFFVHNMTRYLPTHFNVPSTILFCCGFTFVMIGLTQTEGIGIMAPSAWGSFVAGIAILTFYVWYELGSRNPLLHLKCFRSRRFTIDCVLIVFAQASMMIASIMVPLYMQGVQGSSATASGLAIMPGAILLGVLNPLTGRLYDRFGARPLALAGCLLLLVGTIAFVFCTPETSVLIIVALYGLRTIGIACLWLPLTADVCKALPPEETVQATAITTSMRQLFSAMLSTIFVSIMTVFTTDASGISNHGFDISFGVLSLLTLVMFAMAIVFVRRKPRLEYRSD